MIYLCYLFYLYLFTPTSTNNTTTTTRKKIIIEFYLITINLIFNEYKLSEREIFSINNILLFLLFL
jgi:hypothetical protein